MKGFFMIKDETVKLTDGKYFLDNLKERLILNT